MKYVRHIEERVRNWQNIGFMELLDPKRKKETEIELKEQFTKYNQGKAKLTLLPIKAKTLVAHVIAFGADKYGKDNWKLCNDKSIYVDAALRHIDAFLSGEKHDEESGMDHLAHAVANLMFVMELK